MRPVAVLLFGGVLGCAAAAPPLRETARDRAGPPRQLVTRVVDADSGAPIPGATLTLVLEDLHPIPHEPRHLVRRVSADRDGWVRVRVDDLRPGERGGFDCIYVQAPGYAPWDGEERDLAPQVALRRGWDLAVRVFDAVGRPASGAWVDVHLGCGHTPAVVSARTGADGRCVLPAIGGADGTGWIAGRGLLAEYADFDLDTPGPERVTWREPAIAVEGRVLEHDGRPAAGVFVGCRHCHRGPWCRTDAAGAFRLEGVPPLAQCEIDRPGADRPVRYFTAPPPGNLRILRLPPPGTDETLDDDDEPAEGARPSRVTVRDAAGTLPDAVPIFAVRPADGCTIEGWLPGSADAPDGDPRAGGAADPDERRCELLLPPGRWRVTVGGALSPWREQAAALVVDTDPGEATLELVRAPQTEVRWTRLPAAATLVLATPTHERRIGPTDVERPGDGRVWVAVPPSGPCVIRVRAHGRTTVTPIPELARANAGAVELDWGAPTRVCATLRTADGRRALGRLRITAWRPDGWLDLGSEGTEGTDRPVVETWASGAVEVSITADDEALQSVTRRVVLPATVGGLVDLGTIVLRPH